MKYFCSILILWGSVFCCYANEEHLFDVILIPSIADSELDFWFCTPPNSGPSIPKVKQVYPNQTFMLLMFSRVHPVASQTKVDIIFDLKLISPDGKISLDEKSLSFYKGSLKDNKLIMPDNVSDMAFDKMDSLGKYQIETVFHEAVSKRTYKTSVEIELIEFKEPEAFASEEELSDWVMNYYRHPDSVRSFSGILYFVEVTSEWIKENGATLAFYRRIFQDNPFLWEYYAELYKTASDTDKRKMLLVAAIIPSRVEKEVFLKEVKDEMRVFYDNASKIVIPNTDQEITTPLQLDILWSEFLASGTYQPIKRIVSALELKKYEEIVEQVKSGAIPELTGKIKKKFMLGVVYQAAEWSLISNCMQFHRVHQYCQTIYEHETLKPEIKEALGFVLAVVERKKQEEIKSEKSEKQ